MSESLIICGGASAPPRRAGTTLELDVSPAADASKRIRFDPGAISARLLDDLPDTLADAVEVAAYVFSADRLIRRGSGGGRHIGAEWQRRLRFRIPVRRHELWNSREVKDALGSALNFLSGDEISFEFTRAEQPVSIEPFLGFRDDGAQTIRPDKVILFSGGLDSLAGVAENIIGKGQSAVLVAHQSANITANYQNLLAQAIAQRTAKNQTFYAPIWVRRGKSEPVEHTQRLRSFLFASLGMAYAYMFGQKSLYFYENGITSFNLPIAEQVVGTRASRTTHPHVLRRFGDLFSLLLGEPVSFENPFLWKTKADVVNTIANHGCADLIAMTTSCASIRALSMSGRQCGSCSQCVERRFAVLAASQEKQERPDAYDRDLFTGAHEDGRDLTMVEAHVLRAQKLATMSEHAFLSNYGQVFRALSDIDGSPHEVARRIFELHQRYGASVVEVFDGQSRLHASLAAIQNLPPTSLLGMIRAPIGRPAAFLDPIEAEPKPSVEAGLDHTPVRPRRFTFAMEERAQRIVFAEGPVLKGISYKLFARLARQFQSDLECGVEKTDYAFIRTEILLKEFNQSGEGLRQQIWRLRKSLTRQFEKMAGYTLDQNDIIESVNWTGYRLNPYLVLVDAPQLAIHAETSRSLSKIVTSRGLPPGNPGFL